MKPKHRHAVALTTMALMLPATADIIYSNFQNISIPNTYAGVYLDVQGAAGSNTSTDMFSPGSGWDINPFFGGQEVASSPTFQPVRSGTGSSSFIVNLAAGSIIGSGSTFTTEYGGAGYGWSDTHLGLSFTAGTEGYLGFRINNVGYGWMRVVLGGATPVIMDWAYDTSGTSGSIVAGRIQQSAPSGNTQVVTLSPQGAESFALGSVIADSGAGGSVINSVLKTGTGTTVLASSSTYTGTTTVSAGTLVVNGSISTSSLTTVNSGATLAGSGVLGTVSLENLATLAPGPADGGIAALGLSGALTLGSGSYSVFEINNLGGSTSADLANVSGLLTFGGTLNVSYIGSGSLATGNVFNLFDWSSYSGSFSAVNLPALDSGLVWDQTNLYVNGQIAVIPEPDVAALIGGLGLLALIRRRR